MSEDSLPQISTAELGRRIYSARRARGLTQEDLALAMGFARTTITAIEKGQRRIQPAELVRFAALLAKPLSEFTRTESIEDAFGVQLRASVRAPEFALIHQKIDEFEQLCADFLELERIGGVSHERNYPRPYEISGNPERVAEDIATRERHRLNLGDAPILNLRQMLEEDVGLRIFYLEMPSDVAAMFSYTQAAGGCIAVNRVHPPERRRMSLGHEFGHFVARRRTSEISFLAKYERVPEHERFAEAFARAFLMPGSGIVRRFHETQKSRGGKITPADLCRLAHLYFVSVEALTLRLEELRLISAGSWERLKQRGFKVREAQRLLDLAEQPINDQTVPLAYQYLALEAYERGSISEGQLGRYLRLDRLSTRELVNRLSHKRDLSSEGAWDSIKLDFAKNLSDQ